MRLVEVPVSTLEVGRRFRLHLDLAAGRPVTGTVLDKSSGSVTVGLDQTTQRTFTTQDGSEVKFKQYGGLAHWALSTLVEKLDEVRQIRAERQEGEDMAAGQAVALPGVGGSAARKAAKVTRLKVAGKAKPAKSKAKDNPCKCGCGEKVAGNFKMGHDGRFYSQVKKVARGEIAFNALNKHMQGVLKNKAECMKLDKAHSR